MLKNLIIHQYVLVLYVIEIIKKIFKKKWEDIRHQRRLNRQEHRHLLIHW